MLIHKNKKWKENIYLIFTFPMHYLSKLDESNTITLNLVHGPFWFRTWALRYKKWGKHYVRKIKQRPIGKGQPLFVPLHRCFSQRRVSNSWPIQVYFLQFLPLLLNLHGAEYIEIHTYLKWHPPDLCRDDWETSLHGATLLLK